MSQPALKPSSIIETIDRRSGAIGLVTLREAIRQLTAGGWCKYAARDALSHEQIVQTATHTYRVQVNK